MGLRETAKNARANISRTIEGVIGKSIEQFPQSIEEIIEHHRLDGFRFFDYKYYPLSRYNPTGPMKDAYKGDNGKALFNLYCDGGIGPRDRLYGACLDDPKGRLGHEFLFARPLRPLIDSSSKSSAPRYLMYSLKTKRIEVIENLINWRKFPQDECVSKEVLALIDKVVNMGANSQDIIFE